MKVFPAALRPEGSTAWRRPPTVAEAPKVDAKHYHESIGTRCGMAAGSTLSDGASLVDEAESSRPREDNRNAPKPACHHSD